VDVPLTQYARSGELAIAYQVHGSGEHDLLFSVSISNIDSAWQFPEAVRLFERLGRFARVIRFDRRDSGLSDPIKDDLTIEAHVADALAVMDAVGADRPVLLGAAEAGRALAALAATRPERAAGIIAINNPFAAATILTLFLGIFLIAGGIVRMFLAWLAAASPFRRSFPRSLDRA